MFMANKEMNSREKQRPYQDLLQDHCRRMMIPLLSIDGPLGSQPRRLAAKDEILKSHPARPEKLNR